MGITPEDIQAQRELLERGERILEAQEQQAERERLRDTFAAAALTGFTRGIPDNGVFHLGLIAKQAYEVADAMMRERLQIESAEYTDGISPSTETKSTAKIRRDAADLRCGLTDAEREAVEWFACYGVDRPLGHSTTLRGLLERLK